MQTREEIIERIKGFLENECGLASKELRPDTKLFGRGMLDSTEVLKLVLFMEEEFNAKTPLFEVSFSNFETIDKIAALVQSHLASTES